MTKICIVSGCYNAKGEGGFVGDICIPCYEMIINGEAERPSTNFIHELYLENKKLKERLKEFKK